ncbi:MAG: gliding motility-associated ABC transporter permease subunit GldF [Flavobacteriia bacterium]|nr:MAG: gliding motility-associated ABC transporter permease subunit GldF [Flavobacteriia bacterium]
MFSIFKKEFNTFFANPLGYGIIGLFLLVNGLLLWVLRSDWNIFNSGFADMQGFFDLIPWVFIVLIPAMLMRTFSEEYTLGTVELLKTRPVSAFQVVFGKYLAIVTIVTMSLILTLVYILALDRLAAPQTIDFGSITGSYLGLWLLSIAMTAIALWIAVLLKNQLLAFIIGVLVLLLLYYGGEQLAQWYDNAPDFLRQITLYEHYKSMGRGVLDLRDIAYFISVVILFITLSINRFKRL